ncbi:MAG TPA: protein kinase [Kofleriaceae bacterium]
MADLSGRTLGEYILREQIEEGGDGAVYRGEQPALEREVVIKVLHEERGDSDSRERFLREARRAAQLRHPYAAQVYAFGAEDNESLLWIAMERVQGVSHRQLQDLERREDRLLDLEGGLAARPRRREDHQGQGAVRREAELISRLVSPVPCSVLVASGVGLGAVVLVSTLVVRCSAAAALRLAKNPHAERS